MSTPEKDSKQSGHLRLVWMAGLGAAGSYLAIGVLSRRFLYGHNLTARPIPTVLALFALAFAWYLVAIWAAVRSTDNRRLLGLIVAGSVVFRVTLLFSWPIQEVDIYRYLWDGQVTVQGVSPFRYSPRQVLDAGADDPAPDDLRRLVLLRDGSPAVATILQRVHYEELPTVYPPVSQAVFAACALVTPRGASVFQRLTIMKFCFILFDLATLAIVFGLVRRAGLHAGWTLAYGWCPLLVKEIANSGHLDAVAVFLATAALFVAVGAFFGSPQGVERSTWSRSWLRPPLAAALLALAVGAKLYPVVFAPLLVVTSVRRLGWRKTIGPTLVFVLLTVAVLWPMLGPRRSKGSASTVAGAEAERPLEPSHLLGTPGAIEAPDPTAPTDLPPLPTTVAGSTVEPQDPGLGLKTFLGRWEMNDLLFMLVVENVKPDGDRPVSNRAWFAVLPDAWRVRMTRGPGERLDVSPKKAAFLMTRLATSVLILVVAVILAWRGASSQAPRRWLEAAFLTIAWFWLLSPTQNPWYWAWAMPLVVFARGRAWLLVSGLTMIYYLRFWLGYHWPDEPLAYTFYAGKNFFDYIVVCLEFGPWFMLLAGIAVVRRRFRGPSRNRKY